MIFKPMKTEDVLKALEGQENILTPAVQENERFFKTLTCPSCGGGCSPYVNARRPFVEGSILPNYLARCNACGTEFEPYTKIVISLPKMGR